MRFGESFPQGSDSQNRLDALRIKNKEIDVPAYIHFGLEIREQLRAEAEDNPPVMPRPADIQKIEDVFEIAKQDVNAGWEKSVQPLIDEKINLLAQRLPTGDPELDILKDKTELSKKLRTNQLGALEPLRQKDSEIWRILNIVSSERQLAIISILEAWLRDGNNDEAWKAISEKIGLNREELRLFVDLAAIFGKYIDQAFIKQMELADQPGGSEATKLGDKSGAEFIYDLYSAGQGEKISRRTYKEMFSFEWPRIAKRLHDLSDRTEREVSEGKLPAEYAPLASYLQEMSEVYGSDSTNLRDLDRKWKHLYKIGAELNSSRCPISLVPQGAASVSGEANKVDIEMRLGLKTAETMEQGKALDGLRTVAQEIADSYLNASAKKIPIPKVFASYQAFAFGPNPSSVTTGESDEKLILLYPGSDKDIVMNSELPKLGKLLPGEKVDSEAYLATVVKENALHEIGHAILPAENEAIKKRIGVRFETTVLDELKAETMSVRILRSALKSGRLPENMDLRTQLLAKISSNFNYLEKNSDKRGGDGEEYYLCGATIIGRLLAKGLLVKTSDGYELGKTDSCLKEIDSIGDELLPLYSNPSSRPSEVKRFVENLRENGQSQVIKDFVNDLKKTKI